MVTCIDYSNSVECALSLTNDYNIKLLILSLVFILSVAMLIYSKHTEKTKDEDLHGMVKNYIFKFIPPIYIAFSPLSLILLRHNISFEIFIIIFSGMAGIVVTLALLLTFSLVPRGMFNVMGQKEKDIWKTNLKHEATERKHG